MNPRYGEGNDVGAPARSRNWRLAWRAMNSDGEVMEDPRTEEGLGPKLTRTASEAGIGSYGWQSIEFSP